ncbi:hypothetical protein DAEQUDRAFT_410414 [Daedalea quercina L-15889]|uniref:Uncharacterized protein n=1 Tax=Daedalea quercina L-15889 TaxID=1314783 RepID=A0A165NKS7_9APHY|nr:hypothetical protein DAEQUDRAFT_410414 [Daedalea quercina L-15889]
MNSSAAESVACLSRTAETLLALAFRVHASVLDVEHRATMNTVEDDIQKALLLVQNARNRLTPINCLPSEILCMIFIHVVDSARPSSRHRLGQGLNTIQSVCQLWRRLALSCPTLWSAIEVNDKTSADELQRLLQRAGGVPLQVSAFGADHLLQCIGPLMDRMRTLEVTFGTCPVQDMEPSHRLAFLFKPAPLLEGLHISADDDGQDHIMIPTLFQNRAPRLSRLFLSQHFACTTNRFPNLTHLWLRAQYTFSPSSLGDFLDFLEASPTLEQLVLEEAGPCVLPELLPAFPSPRRVTLERLHTLVFDVCRWAVVACVLRHVVPSAHVGIKICEPLHLTRSHELLSVFVEDAAFLTHVDHIRQLSVWCLGSQFFLECETSLASLTVDLVWDAILPSSIHGSLSSALVAELPTTLSLGRVTQFSLLINDGAPIWPLSVKALLYAMPAVESCTIWVDPELDKTYWRGILGSKLLMPFPRLKSLHVVGELPDMWKPFWVLGLAIRRAKRGYPLQELTCSAVKGGLWDPEFVHWDPEKMHLSGQRVLDFVGKVEFRGIESSNEMEPPVIINHWDGTV